MITMPKVLERIRMRPFIHSSLMTRTNPFREASMTTPSAEQPVSAGTTGEVLSLSFRSPLLGDSPQSIATRQRSVALIRTPAGLYSSLVRSRHGSLPRGGRDDERQARDGPD